MLHDIMITLNTLAETSDLKYPITLVLKRRYVFLTFNGYEQRLDVLLDAKRAYGYPVEKGYWFNYNEVMAEVKERLYL